jgi:hypothetical protein
MFLSETGMRKTPLFRHDSRRFMAEQGRPEELAQWCVAASCMLRN